MRIQEKQGSATCAKMTEEKGINGGPDIPLANKRACAFDNVKPRSPSYHSSTDPDGSTLIAGGRLKFFKGKYLVQVT